MHIQIGVSEHTAVSYAELQHKFKLAESPQARRAWVREGIEETREALKGVERGLEDVRDAATKRELVNQHVMLQKDLRNLKDLDIVAEIADDADALRNLQKLDEVKNLLAKGETGQALQKMDRLMIILPNDEISGLITTLGSSSSLEAKQAALLEVITKYYDEVFTRHNISGPGQRARIQAHLAEIYFGENISAKSDLTNLTEAA